MVRHESVLREKPAHRDMSIFFPAKTMNSDMPAITLEFQPLQLAGGGWNSMKTSLSC